MRAIAGILTMCFLATRVSAQDIEATQLTVRSAQVQLDDDVYELDARLDIGLPQAARKAIDGGLTLRLRYEINVDRVRHYWPDAGVATVTQRYEVTYHALSQRYLVRNLNTGEQQDYGSLQGALDKVSDLRGLPILDSALIQDGPSYEGRIRAVLELTTAPDALGWLLFWSDNWSGESDWYTWTLRH